MLASQTWRYAHRLQLFEQFSTFSPSEQRSCWYFCFNFAFSAQRCLNTWHYCYINIRWTSLCWVGSAHRHRKHIHIYNDSNNQLLCDFFLAGMFSQLYQLLLNVLFTSDVTWFYIFSQNNQMSIKRKRLAGTISVDGAVILTSKKVLACSRISWLESGLFLQ